MGQLKDLLDRLALRQKISIVVAALVVMGGLFAAARWNKERDFKPLYKEVAAEDAGAVLARLKESAVDYRVAENGSTILVPSSKVAELRLQMAAAGLPKTGRIGFELFDGTNFGTTEFAEQVNYHRAIEGELERSVMALSEVQSARVHVTLAKDSVFSESRQPAKASVMVKLKPGSRLAPPNVSAITHLVASAVEGLLPEAVSVLDMNGNLLSKPRRPSDPDGLETSETSLEFRQKVEKDLLAKIHGTLEPLLGPEKYRAGISVECDFTSGEQSEETFDPTKSVMVNSQRTEETSGSNSTMGIPGSASNMPRSQRSASAGGAGVSRRTENISYQSSHMVKRLRLPQGTLRRLSIAILVDQSVQWEGTGPKAKQILVPPPPERLKVIRDVVAGVVGFQTERGDQLTVETLPFESTLSLEPPPAPSATPAAPQNGFQLQMPPWAANALKGVPVPMPVLIGAAAGIILLLLLAMVFFFLKSRKKRLKVKLEKEALAAAQAKGELPAVPEGPTFESQMQAKLAENAALQERQEQEALSALQVHAGTTKKTEILKKHIVEQAKKDPSALAHIMRSWLSEMEER